MAGRWGYLGKLEQILPPIGLKGQIDGHYGAPESVEMLRPQDSGMQEQYNRKEEQWSHARGPPVTPLNSEVTLM